MIVPPTIGDEATFNLAYLHGIDRAYLSNAPI